MTGNPNGLGCWSNGGTNPNGYLRVYIADVLRFLPVDSTNGVPIANAAHTVKLADSGGNGNGQVTQTRILTLAARPGEDVFKDGRALETISRATFAKLR